MTPNQINYLRSKVSNSGYPADYSGFLLMTFSFVVGWVSKRLIELAIGSLLLIPILGMIILGVSFSALAVCPELRTKLANFR